MLYGYVVSVLGHHEQRSLLYKYINLCPLLLRKDSFYRKSAKAPQDFLLGVFGQRIFRGNWSLAQAASERAMDDQVKRKTRGSIVDFRCLTVDQNKSTTLRRMGQLFLRRLTCVRYIGRPVGQPIDPVDK